MTHSLTVIDYARPPLEGSVIFVTGAGNGLGRAIARQCGRAGAKVVAFARSENLTETISLCEEDGSTILGIRGDVTSADDLENAVSLTLSHFSRLDSMIHNATSSDSSKVGTVETIGGPGFDDQIAVSLRGGFLCAKASYAALVESKGSYLVMTSPAAMEGSLSLPTYGAVKGGLRAMAKSLALEWGPIGVRVNSLSPLGVSPALANAYRENPELEGRMKAVTPLGWIGDADQDIAPVVVFLCSKGARYITGQTIVVDGGRYTAL